MSHLIILSGGLDSTVLAYSIKQKHNLDCVDFLTFNYGSKHNQKEIEQARITASLLGGNHTIIDLDFINLTFRSNLLKNGDDIPHGHYQESSMKKNVVPFRNGIMISIAAGFAESNNFKNIYLGNHFGDHDIFPDCRSVFFESMKKAILFGTYQETILNCPFVDVTKDYIVKLGESLSVPFENAWSCYQGKSKHCGRCGTCVERIEAFKLANVLDPTEYNYDL